MEETTLEIEIKEIVGTFTKPYKPNHIFIGFIAKALSGKLKAMDDILESKYIDPEKTPFLHGTIAKEVTDYYLNYIESCK